MDVLLLHDGEENGKSADIKIDQVHKARVILS